MIKRLLYFFQKERNILLLDELSKKSNKYEERNSFPYGETIAHDKRYVIKDKL